MYICNHVQMDDQSNVIEMINPMLSEMWSAFECVLSTNGIKRIVQILCLGYDCLQFAGQYNHMGVF